jgi:hypothetical protein
MRFAVAFLLLLTCAKNHGQPDDLSDTAREEEAAERVRQDELTAESEAEPDSEISRDVLWPCLVQGDTGCTKKMADAPSEDNVSDDDSSGSGDGGEGNLNVTTTANTTTTTTTTTTVNPAPTVAPSGSDGGDRDANLGEQSSPEEASGDGGEGNLNTTTTVNPAPTVAPSGSDGGDRDANLGEQSSPEEASGESGNENSSLDNDNHHTESEPEVHALPDLALSLSAWFQDWRRDARLKAIRKTAEADAAAEMIAEYNILKANDAQSKQLLQATACGHPDPAFTVNLNQTGLANQFPSGAGRMAGRIQGGHISELPADLSASQIQRRAAQQYVMVPSTDVMPRLTGQPIPQAAEVHRPQ